MRAVIKYLLFLLYNWFIWEIAYSGIQRFRNNQSANNRKKELLPQHKNQRKKAQRYQHIPRLKMFSSKSSVDAAHKTMWGIINNDMIVIKFYDLVHIKKQIILKL